MVVLTFSNDVGIQQGSFFALHCILAIHYFNLNREIFVFVAGVGCESNKGEKGGND